MRATRFTSDAIPPTITKTTKRALSLITVFAPRRGSRNRGARGRARCDRTSGRLLLPRGRHGDAAGHLSGQADAFRNAAILRIVKARVGDLKAADRGLDGRQFGRKARLADRLS